ncbi:MAG: hypothetical protein RLP44_27080 [Aggregatilineales bacterium]
MGKNTVETAIVRTILYGDVFNFAMTPTEIHHFLIHDTPVSLKTVKETLYSSAYLAQVLHITDTYIACSGREDLITIRHQREQATGNIWSGIQRYGYHLARLPFVRMVAITGALAMRNGKETDDFDYLLITEPGRVWMARAFAILLVRYGKLRGVTVCPNYVLAANALEQNRQDLYIAHEIVQMIPIYGLAIYDDMRDQNRWAAEHLPNAGAPFYQETEWQHGRLWNSIKSTVEWLLSGRFGTWLEEWERKRKIRQFQKDLQSANENAKLDETQVKGHFKDYGHLVLREYQHRLAQYELEDLPLAGD